MDIFKFLVSSWNTIISFLPGDPFIDSINSLETADWLHAVCYFVPISDFVKILGVWILAVGGYYAYSALARWAKLLQ